MDGEVLLKKVYKIQDDAKHKIESFHKQYKILVEKQKDGGMSFDYRMYRDTSETAVGTSLRMIDKVRSLDVEVVDFTKALREKLLNILPNSPVKLKRLLEKEVKRNSIIPEGDYDLPPSFYDTARHINELNAVLAQMDLIAGEIEKVLDRKAVKLEYISIVSYDRTKSVLTINSKKQTIGAKSPRMSALLAALFGSKRRNLVSQNIDDADTFEAIREVDQEKYNNKASQRKCALDTYKIINDKIRKNIPNGEDLIVRTDNGFTINSELIK